MVKLYTARDGMEAKFLCGLLENAGVQSVIQGELLAAARGELPITQETLPSVWVKLEDLDRATSTLREYRDGSHALPPRGDTWVCPACGEVCEGQFTQCWKCESPRPESSDRTQ